MTPVLASLPVKIGALLPKPAEARLIRVIGAMNAGWLLKAMGIARPIADATFAFIPWTPIFNVTGQPAASVPITVSADGLPIGMHLVGRFGDEATLFSLSGQMERARPWNTRRAPLD
jgi:amidase